MLSPMSERVLLEVVGNEVQRNFILFCLQKRGRKIERPLLEVTQGCFENAQRVQIEERLYICTTICSCLYLYPLAYWAQYTDL